MPSRLLIVTGQTWPQTAHIAVAARDAGFTVHLLGPKGHPVVDLEWVRSQHSFSAMNPSRSVARALNGLEVDFVMAVDDLAGVALFEAYESGRLNERAAAVVARSLGDPASFRLRYQRAVLAEIAAIAGLPTPVTVRVPDEGALEAALDTVGFPAVLKVDEGFGGEQVIVVDDPDSGAGGFRRLAYPPRITSGVGGLIFDHNPLYLRQAMTRRWPAVTVQQFVPGDAATLSAVAWEGQVLASVSFRAVHTSTWSGPANVVEAIQHDDMDRAARVVAAELGLSGPFGLDFVLAPDRSTASLIELNPRATPTLHLWPSSLDKPLLHVLADHVGTDARSWGPSMPAGPVALFPQALIDGIDLESCGACLELPGEPGVLALCQAAVKTQPQPPSGALIQALRRAF